MEEKNNSWTKNPNPQGIAQANIKSLFFNALQASPIKDLFEPLCTCSSSKFVV